MSTPAPSPSQTPSAADVAAEVASLSGGLGIVAVALFPFAIPALLLVAPVALLAVPVLLPVGIYVLIRRLIRAVPRRTRPAPVPARTLGTRQAY
jgi:hypothetical protein